MREKMKELRRSLIVMVKVAKVVNHEGRRSGKCKDSWLKIPRVETSSLLLLMVALLNRASEKQARDLW